MSMLTNSVRQRAKRLASFLIDEYDSKLNELRKTKPRDRNYTEQSKIDNLERLKKEWHHSRVLPVWVNGVIVNGYTLEGLDKHIKQPKTFTVSEDCLTVFYDTDHPVGGIVELWHMERYETYLKGLGESQTPVVTLANREGWSYV